ncbi:MAG: hypothetical protein KDB03_26075 [Planctomycetales bacterium]|nr:hypothetical protein [Planctomycetales bacterium]
MNSFFATAWFLGQSNPLETVRREFEKQQSGFGSGTWGMLAILLVALVVAGAILWAFKNSTRKFSDARSLFSQLCRAHHLSYQQRKLMLLLAKESQLQPSYLFLSSEAWQVPHDCKRLRKESCLQLLQKTQRTLFEPAPLQSEL